MIMLPILTTSLIHFSTKGWENVLFELGSKDLTLVSNVKGQQQEIALLFYWWAIFEAWSNVMKYKKPHCMCSLLSCHPSPLPSASIPFFFPSFPLPFPSPSPSLPSLSLPLPLPCPSVFHPPHPLTSNTAFVISRNSHIQAQWQWYSSGSSEASKSAKSSKDEPVVFSTSKAKSKTLDDTLGAQKSNSSFPFYLGFGLLTFLLYFGFIRREDPSVAERWDLFKMNHSSEQAFAEGKLTGTTEKDHSTSWEQWWAGFKSNWVAPSKAVLCDHFIAIFQVAQNRLKFGMSILFLC